MSMVFSILGILVGLCILGALVIIVYAALKPSDDTSIAVEERRPLKLESISAEEAVFSTQMPLRNEGAEDAAILDILARPYLPEEQFPDAVCYGHVETTDRRRNDNYFEALILKKHTERTLVVTLRFIARNGKNIKDVLEHMVDMDTCIYCSGLARKDMYVKKFFFTEMGVDISKLVGGAENGR